MTTRVGTFNLLHGMPGGLPSDGDRSEGDGSEGDGADSADATQARADLQSAAARLDADVLGLQEVDHAQPRSLCVDQTAAVAAALGASDWRFVPTLLGTPGVAWEEAAHGDHTGPDGVVGAHSDGPSYGIGLVSRLPVRQWDVIRFPASPASLPLMVQDDSGRGRLLRVADEPRAALAAVVEGPRGPFTVVTLHLSFVPGVNVRQLRAVSRWARRFPDPLVVAGDLNLPAWAVRWSTAMTPLVRTATFPSGQPRVQLDHVLARGLPAEARLGARGHRLALSDHLALSADLDL